MRYCWHCPFHGQVPANLVQNALKYSSRVAAPRVGLATVKRIIDRHGGRIEFYSEVGRGTTVRFTLAPAAPATGA
jgi:signal transduction histidine kinase